MTNQFKRSEENQPSSPEEAEPIVLTEDAAAASPEKTQASAQVEDLSAQLAEKDKQLTEFRDKYLRVLADSENVRKRIRQQSEESVRIQRENLLRDLLPIVDNLERAVDAARGGGNGKPIVEGVEMVLRSLMDYLRSQGVTPVDAVGQAFDPQHHEAVEHEPSDQHPPNTVVREFHRGYQIGDRMLRPAQVSVAKQTGPRDSSKDKDE